MNICPAYGYNRNDGKNTTINHQMWLTVRLLACKLASKNKISIKGSGIVANVNLDAFDKIIVLDFGSQYNRLITRRLRDFGVYS